MQHGSNGSANVLQTPGFSKAMSAHACCWRTKKLNIVHKPGDCLTCQVFGVEPHAYKAMNLHHNVCLLFCMSMYCAWEHSCSQR